ncbi:MAG TPA: methyltransferase domain-containing protein [Polyangia bacterium]|nr:methyltransferase domain-containing protein [Polyangia bacterium]
MSEPLNRWDPGLYAGRAAFVTAAGQDLVELLAPRAGERVLDVGCGTGELTAAIAARGASVTGLDFSDDMLASARAKQPGLTFVAGDAQDLPASFTGAFDAVFSNAALHWMPRMDDVVAGVARALTPHGRFVAELGGRGNTDTVLRGLRAVLPRLGLEPERFIPWTFPSPAAYATILERHGFRVRFLSHFDRPSRMDGAGGLRAWLTIFSAPLMAALGASGDRRDVFFSLMENACASLRRDDAAGLRWEIDYVRLRFLATLD